jgi:hypothetical protein
MNITFLDKSQDETPYNPAYWNAQDANEIKAAVNSKADREDLTSKANVSELATKANQSALNEEINIRLSGYTYLETAINNEANVRLSGYTLTTNNINTISGTTNTLSTNLNNEISIRLSGHTTLQNQINNISTGIGTASPSDSPQPNIRTYNVSVAGTYSNFSGIIVTTGDTTSGLVQLQLNSSTGSTWNKVVTPVNIGDNFVTGNKIANDSVSLNKTSFYVIGKNKFDKSKASVGYVISTTGNIDSGNPAYDTSDFIPVTTGVRYQGNGLMNFRAFYDANKVVISHTATGNANFIIIPSGVSFIRFSIAHTLLDTFQFEIGLAASTYEPYSLFFDTSKFESKSITGDKILNNSLTSDKLKLGGIKKQNTSFFSVGKNMFNPFDTDIKRGYYLGAVGQEASNSGYSISGYMPLESGQTIFNSSRTYSSAAYTAFYDGNFKFLGASNLLGATAPSGTTYVRDSINLNATDDITIKTIQIEIGTGKTIYQPYSNALSLDAIPKEVVRGSDQSSLPEAFVQPKNTTFFRAGLNLFNPSDPDFLPATYLGGSGQLIASVSYNTTGFILIDRAGSIFSSNNSILNGFRFIMFYDANKNPITASYQQNLTTIPLYTGAKFFRVSYNVLFTSYQLEIGAVASRIYLPFEYGLDSIYIPSTISRDKVEAFLPLEICVPLGTILELYNNQVAYCGNEDNFTFQWNASTSGNTKSIGELYQDKFRIDTSSKAIGLLDTYLLTLSISDNNGNLLTTVTSSLKVVTVGANIATPLRGIAVGDSLCNKPWLPEARNVLNTAFGKDVLHWEGTLAYNNSWQTPVSLAQFCRNEGRSGYRQEQYLNAGFGGQIRIYVSGVTIAPAPKKQYRFNSNTGLATFEVEDVFNQDGQLYSASGGTITTITLNTAAGQSTSTLQVSGQTTGGVANGVSGGAIGDSTLNYSKFDNVGGNPFWNPSTLAVDFAWYFIQNSIPEPDFFLTMLGTNAITDVNSLVTFVNLIQTQMPNKKVYVMLPQYPGNYLLQPAVRKRFYDFGKNVSTVFASNPNVFLIPVMYTHDSEHNFLSIEEGINPRNTTQKRLKPADYVHPQKEGYFQFADAVAGALMAHYS